MGITEVFQIGWMSCLSGSGIVSPSIVLGALSEVISGFKMWLFERRFCPSSWGKQVDVVGGQTVSYKIEDLLY